MSNMRTLANEIADDLTDRLNKLFAAKEANAPIVLLGPFQMDNNACFVLAVTTEHGVDPLFIIPTASYFDEIAARNGIPIKPKEGMIN